MTKEAFCEVLSDINGRYVEEAGAGRKARKPVWLKWGAVAACLCIILISIFTFVPSTKFWTPEESSGNTLPGALELYPTLMVNNRLYEWRKGAAIAEDLPDDAIYYVPFQDKCCWGNRRINMQNIQK